MWSANFVRRTKTETKNSNIDNISPPASGQLPHCHEANKLGNSFRFPPRSGGRDPQAKFPMFRLEARNVSNKLKSRLSSPMALYRPWLSICGQTQEQHHEQVLFRGAFQKGIRKSLFIFLALPGGGGAFDTSCIFNVAYCFKNQSSASECSLFLVLSPTFTHHAVRALFCPAHNCMSQ